MTRKDTIIAAIRANIASPEQDAYWELFHGPNTILTPYEQGYLAATESRWNGHLDENGADYGEELIAVVGWLVKG